LPDVIPRAGSAGTLPSSDPFADLIQPFSHRGVELGLERLQAALAELGHPERRFAAVQVAGTNGKGSICTLVHAALLAAGIRAGLYTSPHLSSWTERIQLGGAPISELQLRAQLQAARPVAERHRLTPFELVTAAAFLAFAEADLELVVLEVGLGGRLDATSCHPDRRVVGFASIGLDHLEVLGPDAASIALEKAGALGAGVEAVSGPQMPAVEAVLRQQAARLGVRLRWVTPLDDKTWTLGLPGQVQQLNAAVALGMLQALGRQGWDLPEQAIREGFAAARWPGRLQRLQWQGLPLLIDGAHNAPAAQRLRAELDQHGRRHGLPPGARRWVLGMLANKQGAEILQALLGPGDQAWIVPVPGHASWRQSALLGGLGPGQAARLHSAPDLPTALRAAARQGRGPVLVAGSLYLLGHLLASAAAPG
jgi:dihydrofolate synthase/folylpolyglutamate synthase